MKASELIVWLQKAIEEYGDLDVRYDYGCSIDDPQAWSEEWGWDETGNIRDTYGKPAQYFNIAS